MCTPAFSYLIRGFCDELTMAALGRPFRFSAAQTRQLQRGIQTSSHDHLLHATSAALRRQTRPRLGCAKPARPSQTRSMCRPIWSLHCVDEVALLSRRTESHRRLQHGSSTATTKASGHDPTALTSLCNPLTRTQHSPRCNRTAHGNRWSRTTVQLTA